MSTTNNLVFKGLLIIAWLIFVALSIEAGGLLVNFFFGGLLVNFFFSLYNPAMIANLYQKLDLTEMYSRSKWVFYSMYSFILFIAVLKAYLFYIVINLMHKLDLSKPFNSFVSSQISKLSYLTLSIGFISYAASQLAKYLMHHGFNTNASWF